MLETGSFWIDPQRESENHRQYAYRIIRHNIMTLRLAPGQVINEGELSEVLGVSRTPIREAMLRLKEDFLIDVFPQKLSRVALIDLALVRDGFFVRARVEPGVLEMVRGRLSTSAICRLGENLERQRRVMEGSGSTPEFLDLDNRFHETIYMAAEKAQVWRCVRSISSQYDRFRYFDIVLGADRLHIVYKQHCAFCDLLVSGGHGEEEAGPLDRMVEQHLAGYQALIPQILREHPTYFKMADEAPGKVNS